MSRRTSARLIVALRDVASAEGVDACSLAIERQSVRLLGAPGLRLELGPPTADRAAGEAIALVVDGAEVGRLHAARPLRRARDRALTEIFADHCALALGRVLALDERDVRARRDPLTGLFNHREFHEALESALCDGEAERGSRFAVATFDLDAFKRVNDSGGHLAGDRVLRAAASAIASSCRSTDRAFRVGGDEFAILLPDADGHAATVVGERAAASVRRVAHPDGVSFGVAAWPDDGRSRDTLLHTADEAMYARKQRRPEARLEPKAGEAPRRRLAVAGRLATKLAPLTRPAEIAAVAVDELHEAFGFFLAVVQRLDPDGVLRVVAAAGPLASSEDFLASEQSLTEGVNGRVARTGVQAVIPDTSLDADYLRRDPRTDPGSELSLPIFDDGRIWGVLNLEQLATHAFGDDDLLLADAVAAQVGAALHRSSLTAELERGFMNTLGVLADALETKDPYTAEHAERVADLATAVGSRISLGSATLEQLRYCALLHDIGKITVRSELLSKPGPLTPEEFAEVREHSATGAALLQRIPLLAPVAPLVRAVHERHDGAGYPDGLSGHAIPMVSRIVAACDAFHAITSDRSYRLARSNSEALDELRRCAGSQFDPEVVDVVVEVLGTFEPVGLAAR